MAGHKSVADQLDYMQLRYGEFTRNASTARSNCLQFLQAAEQSLWISAPWSFREETIPFTFTAGVAEYTLVPETAQVLAMRDVNGVEMRKIPMRTFQRYYLDTTVAATIGVPKRWSPRPQETPDQFMVICIWPVPDAGSVSASMDREKRCAVLTDSAAVFSGFPEGLRAAITFKALKNIAIHEGKPDMAQIIQGDIDQFISGLVGRDKELMEGRL